MRKIFLACVVLMLELSPVYAYDISGLWNIDGEGFVKDRRVELKLNGAINGNMNIYTASAAQISQDLISKDLVSTDSRFLTGYDIYIRIDLTKLLRYKVWDMEIPNGIKIPSPLPDVRPSTKNPYHLATVNINNEEQNMNYSITLTSESAGTIRINGIIKNVDYVGDVEIDSESVIWLAGTPKPEIEASVNSGCNSGFGMILFALILFRRPKNVRN